MSIKLAITSEGNVVTRKWISDNKTITANHYREPYQLKPDEHLLLVKGYSSLAFMGVDEVVDYYDDETYVSLWVLNDSEIQKGALRLLAGMELDLPRFLKTGSVRDLFRGLIQGDDDRIVIGVSDDDTSDAIVTLWPHSFCSLLFNYIGTLEELTVQRELTPSNFSIDCPKKVCVSGVDGTFLIVPELSFEYRLNLRACVDTSVEIGKTYHAKYKSPEFTLTVIRHSKLVFEVIAIDF